MLSEDQAIVGLKESIGVRCIVAAKSLGCAHRQTTKIKPQATIRRSFFLGGVIDGRAS